jgi:hypothetical protein
MRAVTKMSIPLKFCRSQALKNLLNDFLSLTFADRAERIALYFFWAQRSASGYPAKFEREAIPLFKYR